MSRKSTLILALLASLAPARWTAAAAAESRVVYDEARSGDLGPPVREARPLARLSEERIHVFRGTGADSVDDADSFVFEVTGRRLFDFCLASSAAEFQWLRAIDPDGTARDVAFGSTNPGFGAPSPVSKEGLPPGTYRVEMAFGPDGARGEWIVKVAPRSGDEPTRGLCSDAVDPTSAEKMARVDWPGAISIFHGHDWGEDEGYLVAIREAGFGAVGSTEAQIAECAELGLRAFVFIWPHEAATIPPKHTGSAAVLCYYLSDRIPSGKWGAWAAFESTAYRASPRQPAVFTMRGLWGSIDRFCPVVRGRVMEFYHYHWDGDRSPHRRFEVLEQLRRASAANGHVPICRVVETRPEDIRKTRQTVFTSLAYGVRGFRTGGRGIFDPERRDARGVPARNPLGEELRRINLAIRAYSPVFASARCRAVYHVPPLPAGCVASPEDASVRLEGEEVLVGVFGDEPARDSASPDGAEAGISRTVEYLLVANRDAFRERSATLHLRGEVVEARRMDRESGRWVTLSTRPSGGRVEATVALEPGGGELLRVDRGGARGRHGAPAAIGSASGERAP